jgi:hypothetical protein
MMMKEKMMTKNRPEKKLARLTAKKVEAFIDRELLGKSLTKDEFFLKTMCFLKGFKPNLKKVMKEKAKAAQKASTAVRARRGVGSY